MRFTPLPALLAVMILLLSTPLLLADAWIAVGEEAQQDGPEWVTGPANTILADYHIFYSDAVGGEVSFHVYLPPGYTEDPRERFPVLYWLHGSGPSIAGVPPLARYFDTMFASGDVHPFIVVFPNGLPTGMWCDAKDGSTPVESMLIGDLIPHIDGNWRTISGREGRLVEGFSMGGYGAGRLGLKYPELFAGFSMMGAGPLQLDFLVDDSALVPLPTRIQIFEEVYGGDMDYFEAQSPWRIAEAQADSLPADLAIRMIVGEEDSMLANNRALHGHFLALEIPHEYRELPGVGHNPLQTINALGQGNWEHYQNVFGH